MPEPLRVFLSYAQRDDSHRADLCDHLSALQRQGLIALWTDREISAGSQQAVSESLERADVVILLVSPSFIASDYCHDREVKRALERHHAKEARVVPILVRPADWEAMPFAQVEVLPRDRRAVTTWPSADEAWTDVAKGLRRVVQEINAERGKPG